MQSTNDENPGDSDTSKTLVIACGAIAHELVTLVKANKWRHLDIQCLPAEWHNNPHRITPAIEKKIRRYKDQYQQIFVAYADCGTGGQLDALLSKHDIQRLPGDHCYGFFSGQAIFDEMAEAELGTFYLTDYLVDHFQRLIMENLGIDRHPELRDQYFGHYTRLIYLRQDIYGNKGTLRMGKAQSAASALGLKLEVHDTGMQQFEHALAPIKIAVR
ncbi:MAG: DUF1638 domain-containing protein [Granulosicoccus sp.]